MTKRQLARRDEAPTLVGRNGEAASAEGDAPLAWPAHKPLIFGGAKEPAAHSSVSALIFGGARAKSDGLTSSSQGAPKGSAAASNAGGGSGTIGKPVRTTAKADDAAVVFGQRTESVVESPSLSPALSAAHSKAKEQLSGFERDSDETALIFGARKGSIGGRDAKLAHDGKSGGKLGAKDEESVGCMSSVRTSEGEGDDTPVVLFKGRGK
eukprot:6213632-Pleurochrysis_carterae.AAC.2